MFRRRSSSKKPSEDGSLVRKFNCAKRGHIKIGIPPSLSLRSWQGLPLFICVVISRVSMGRIVKSHFEKMKTEL